jgi:integrase
VGKKTLTWQIIESLNVLQNYGKPKKENGFDKNPKFIHSIATYDKYKDICIKFGKWAKLEYGVKSLKELKEKRSFYARKYLEHKKRGFDSPYSLRLYGSAIAKLFRCNGSDFGFDYPKRTREVIERSRKERFHDTELSVVNNIDVINFGRYTGLRRKELALLKPEQIKQDKNGNVYLEINKKKYGPQSKGGRDRIVYVLEKGKEHVLRMKDKAANNETVFKKVNNRIDEHSLRREYAQNYYNFLFKNLGENIKYDYMTRDGTNRKFVRKVLRTVSNSLGHNRLDVIVKHYLD